MIRNFITTALRNFTKHKFFTFINIAGLSVGMASCLLILVFVFHELSYDRFHDNHENIYRICARGMIGETKVNQVYTTAKLPETLIMDYGEVVNAARILSRSNVEVKVGEEIYNESRMAAVDSTFFDIFSFPLIEGDAKKVLTEPNTTVLSESTARKYFGDEDPINKVLLMNGETAFKVTGIMKDFPENSHFHFDLLLSVVSFEGRLNDHWWNNNFRTYIVLRDDADPKELGAKFPAFIKKYIGEGKDDWDKWLAAGNNWEYFLQPLASIHLNSSLNGEFEANGNINYIYIFISAALLIVIIASVNFMNLSTAKSEQRSKEVGLRKVVGSSKGLLIFQFLHEAVFMSILAFILSVVLVFIALPWFNSFTGKSFELFDMYNLQTLPYLLAAVLMLGILSGLYPAFYLSSFKPMEVLKSKINRRKNGVNLRGTLVVFQFVISIFLIVGTLVVYRQLDFVQNVNLGFNKEQIVVLHGAGALGNKSETFKELLFTNPNIKKVSTSQTLPGKGFMNWGCNVEGREGWLTLNMNITDIDFLDTYQMQMVEGRFFSKDFLSDSTAIVINENAQKVLGWEDPLQRKVNMNGNSYHVIGVIKDYHYESLHTQVRPMGMIMFPRDWRPSYVSVKITGEDVPETLDFIEKRWATTTGGFPYQFSFFDQEYQQLYDNEVQTSNMFIFFALIAIFIACLGLFALSAFVAEQRTKEIGIRKVNGAGVNNILLLLSSNFAKWVLMAFIISLPLGFFVMRKWLENFAYKIDLNWWIFAVAGLAALFIALMTVSFQSVKAALKNPVDALRYE
jgi:putative ABC transport system permease protein